MGVNSSTHRQLLRASFTFIKGGIPEYRLKLFFHDHCHVRYISSGITGNDLRSADFLK